MRKYLITGAAGYIGSMLAKKIISDGGDVAVIVRDPARLEPELSAAAAVIEADICDTGVIMCTAERYDYVIHCAAPTRSAYMISHPVEVADAIVNGTRNILMLSKQCRAKSVVVLSSMEVYGQIDCPDGRRVTEEELGYIDVTNVRSCYPIAKLMAENLCHSYHREYGVPVKIARLAQTFGRGIRPDETRVFAQFADAVRTGSDIVLHTQGLSMGNYCDIEDAVDAILFLAGNGQASEAYNVVNEANTMSIRDMADLVAEKIAQNRIGVVYDIPGDNRFGYAAGTGLRLSGEKLRKLGWEARYSLEDMYRKMLGER